MLFMCFGVGVMFWIIFFGFATYYVKHFGYILGLNSWLFLGFLKVVDTLVCIYISLYLV